MYIYVCMYKGLHWWLTSKESAYNARDVGLSPSLGRFPWGGNGNPLQYSCLGNPWTERTGGPQSIGSQRIGYDQAWECTYICISVCIDIHIHTYIHTYIYMCVCVCVCVCVYLFCMWISCYSSTDSVSPPTLFFFLNSMLALLSLLLVHMTFKTNLLISKN